LFIKLVIKIKIMSISTSQKSDKMELFCFGKTEWFFAFEKVDFTNTPTNRFYNLYLELN